MTIILNNFHAKHAKYREALAGLRLECPTCEAVTPVNFVNDVPEEADEFTYNPYSAQYSLDGTVDIVCSLCGNKLSELTVSFSGFCGE